MKRKAFEVKTTVAFVLGVWIAACTAVAPGELTMVTEKSPTKEPEGKTQSATPLPTAASTTTTAELDSSALVYRYDDGAIFQAVVPETGKPLPGYEELKVGDGAPHIAYHPPSRRMAVVSYQSGRLFLVDLTGWRVIETNLRFPEVILLDLDSSGDRLAVVYGGASSTPRLALVVVGAAKTLMETELPLGSGHLHWVDGDRGLVLFGEAEADQQSQQEGFLVHYDAATLTEEWTLTLPEVQVGTW